MTVIDRLPPAPLSPARKALLDLVQRTRSSHAGLSSLEMSMPFFLTRFHFILFCNLSCNINGWRASAT